MHKAGMGGLALEGLGAGVRASGAPGQGHAAPREDCGLSRVIRHLPGNDQLTGS